MKQKNKLFSYTIAKHARKCASCNSKIEIGTFSLRYIANEDTYYEDHASLCNKCFKKLIRVYESNHSISKV